MHPRWEKKLFGNKKIYTKEEGNIRMLFSRTCGMSGLNQQQQKSERALFFKPLLLVKQWTRSPVCHYTQMLSVQFTKNDLLCNWKSLCFDANRLPPRITDASVTDVWLSVNLCYWRASATCMAHDVPTKQCLQLISFALLLQKHKEREVPCDSKIKNQDEVSFRLKWVWERGYEGWRDGGKFKRKDTKEFTHSTGSH